MILAIEKFFRTHLLRRHLSLLPQNLWGMGYIIIVLLQISWRMIINDKKKSASGNLKRFLQCSQTLGGCSLSKVEILLIGCCCRGCHGCSSLIRPLGAKDSDQTILELSILLKISHLGKKCLSVRRILFSLISELSKRPTSKTELSEPQLTCWHN